MRFLVATAFAAVARRLRVTTSAWPQFRLKVLEEILQHDFIVSPEVRDKDKALEKLLRSLPPPIYAEDHSVMRRIAEMRFDDRLRQAAAYARELGLWNEPNPLSVMFPKSSLDKTLPELLTVDPRNADDVKGKIDGLRALARVIRRRFPTSRSL